MHLFQMFIDYNLYGMNMLHVAALKFRQPAVGEGTIRLAQWVYHKIKSKQIAGSLTAFKGCPLS